jgi:Xaa-Pro aminopeptidase
LKDLLRTALVGEPSNLIHELKQVKSSREIALIRESARIADTAMTACIEAVAEGRSELEIAASVYQSLLGAGSSLPARIYSSSTSGYRVHGRAHFRAVTRRRRAFGHVPHPNDAF